MKVRRIFVVGAVLATCNASAAFAGPKILATAPAVQDSPMPQTLYCDIVNIDTVPRNVTIEALDVNGVVVAGPAGPVAIPPSQGSFMYSGSGGAWCRFTVDGSTKKFRAVAVYDNGIDYSLSIPAQ